MRNKRYIRFRKKNLVRSLDITDLVNIELKAKALNKVLKSELGKDYVGFTGNYAKSPHFAKWTAESDIVHFECSRGGKVVFSSVNRCYARYFKQNEYFITVHANRNILGSRALIKRILSSYSCTCERITLKSN